MKRGIESLKEAVMRDCAEGENCFCENGCSRHDERTKCTHKYCDQYAWILKRAKEYAVAASLTVEEVVEAWEKDRDYWYMNYYQECEQPSLNGKMKVFVFENVDEFRKSAEGKGFRCPYCGGATTLPQKCDSGLKVELINGKKKKETCNWSAGGLFRTLGKGAQIFLKDRAMTFEVFMPIAWEGKQ